jgi:hypothetical protein
MFSLCIPTINRFDSFLDKNLTIYLTFNLINEIIICDENGNDYNKIILKYKNFIDSGKLKIYKNETVLGPFLNKLKVCSYATTEWIVLIDSDNFADNNYFEIVNKYIIDNNPSKNSILSPSFAKPVFNYKRYAGKIYKKGNMLDNGCLINTGNYVINKYLIDTIDISNEMENIKQSSACDVIFFNTLLFEQLDLQFHVVKELEYEHVVHDQSIYLTTCNNFKKFNEYVYKRFEKNN